MAREPRIAFAATYSLDSTPDSAPRVLLIGTIDAEGKDWRYATWPLSFVGGKDGAVHSGAAFDPFQGAGEILFHDGGADDPLLSVTSADDDGVGTPDQPVVEISHVSVLAVCSAGPGLSGTGGWDTVIADRLARLDTIAFARDLQGNLLDTKQWQVSGARLMLRTGHGAERGQLRGFDLRVFVRMPLGAHAHTVGSNSGDRFDTRLILRLRGERGAGRSLWKTSVEAGRVLQRRGAVCDEISLTATTAPWGGSAADARDEIKLNGPGDLVDFARNAPKAGAARSRVDYVPLLAALDIRIPPGGRAITPFWGFRVAQSYELGAAENVAGELPDVQRLILRAEFRIDGFGEEVRNLFPPDLGPSGDPGVFFSEEQRIADIGLSLRPRDEVHWVIALRLDGAPSEPVDALTRAVVSIYRGVVAEVHEALRRVRDGAPLSLLPQLSDPAAELKEIGAMPWHLVGLALDHEPHVRRIAPASQTPMEAATRAFSYRFLSYEPRFTFDMWNAEQDMQLLSTSGPHDDPANPLMASRVPATFRGLVDTERRRPAAFALIVAPIIRGSTGTKPSSVTRGPAFQAAVTELDFADTEDLPPAVRFGIRFTHFGKSRMLGLGAFLLELSDTATFMMGLSEDTTGLIVMHHPDRRGKDAPRYPEAVDPRLPWSIEALLLLPISRMLPFEQDELSEGVREARGPITRRDRRDETVPLLLDLERPRLPPGEAVDFTLAAVETAARGEDQSVRLSMRATRARRSETQGAKASGMVLVLDPAPFRVAGVAFAAPESAASDEADEIAVWNPEGENGLSWRVRDDGQSVRMIVPPQVLGEAMEKNPGGSEELPQDVVPGRAAAVRFGAPSYLEVDPTFAESGFREPGWNLRRMMGFAGDRSRSRLRDLRLELLYGLTARARQPRDLQAWITEMAGVLGRPALPFDDVAGDKPAVKRHLAMSRNVLGAERRRLAVDRVWGERPDTALHLEEGVGFLLGMREPASSDPANPAVEK